LQLKKARRAENKDRRVVFISRHLSLFFLLCTVLKINMSSIAILINGAILPAAQVISQLVQ